MIPHMKLSYIKSDTRVLSHYTESLAAGLKLRSPIFPVSARDAEYWIWKCPCRTCVLSPNYGIFPVYWFMVSACTNLQGQGFFVLHDYPVYFTMCCLASKTLFLVLEGVEGKTHQWWKIPENLQESKWYNLQHFRFKIFTPNPTIWIRGSNIFSVNGAGCLSDKKGVLQLLWF